MPSIFTRPSIAQMGAQPAQLPFAEYGLPRPQLTTTGSGTSGVPPLDDDQPSPLPMPPGPPQPHSGPGFGNFGGDGIPFFLPRSNPGGGSIFPNPFKNPFFPPVPRFSPEEMRAMNNPFARFGGGF